MSNFLHLIPTQAVQATQDAEGRTVLLRPKFTSPRLQWLQRWMWKPYFRVKLDEVGAFIWEACDGHRSVEEVYAMVKAQFGERAEPVEVRTHAFLVNLARGHFMALLEKDAS